MGNHRINHRVSAYLQPSPFMFAEDIKQMSRISQPRFA